MIFLICPFCLPAFLIESAELLIALRCLSPREGWMVNHTGHHRACQIIGVRECIKMSVFLILIQYQSKVWTHFLIDVNVKVCPNFWLVLYTFWPDNNLSRSKCCPDQNLWLGFSSIFFLYVFYLQKTIIYQTLCFLDFWSLYLFYVKCGAVKINTVNWNIW